MLILPFLHVTISLETNLIVPILPPRHVYLLELISKSCSAVQFYSCQFFPLVSNGKDACKALLKVNKTKLIVERSSFRDHFLFSSLTKHDYVREDFLKKILTGGSTLKKVMCV